MAEFFLAVVLALIEVLLWELDGFVGDLDVVHPAVDVLS